MKIKLMFAWYDFWVGCFYDQKKKTLYFFPIPCFGVKIRIGEKMRWPSYCRMCMRRDGKDPYKERDCPSSEACEHYPFRGKYTSPTD